MATRQQSLLHIRCVVLGLPDDATDQLLCLLYNHVNPRSLIDLFMTRAEILRRDPGSKRECPAKQDLKPPLCFKDQEGNANEDST